MVKLLIKEGADVNRISHQSSSLIQALQAWKGKPLKVTKILLKNGADPRKADKTASRETKSAYQRAEDMNKSGTFTSLLLASLTLFCIV